MKISEQMRVEIARSKIKQNDLADILCMHKSHLSSLLSGSRRPSLDFIIRFSVALKCNIQIDYRDYIDSEISNVN